MTISKNDNEIWWVYSTFRNREEAFSVATKLLEQKLIACANLLENVTSLYHWEGTLHQETECVMLTKTSAAARDLAIQAITDLHSYELPCVVALPLSAGSPPFFRWVKTQTA